MTSNQKLSVKILKQVLQDRRNRIIFELAESGYNQIGGKTLREWVCSYERLYKNISTSKLQALKQASC